MKIVIASFDIGVQNFSQYVEEFSSEDMLNLEEEYKNLPKNKQRKVKGIMNDEVYDIIQRTCLTGKKLQTNVYNFNFEGSTYAENRGQNTLNNNIRLQIMKHLEKHIKLWDKCDIFVIEQQFFNAGGKKSKAGANIDAIKVGEGVLWWFLERYPFKTITYFGSQFKSQILGAPLRLTKQQRKNWAVEKAKEIYHQRDDKEMVNLFNLVEDVKRKRIKTEERIQSFKDEYNFTHNDCKKLSDKIIRNKQKMDDVADAMVQCQAFKFRNMVGCF